MFDPNLLPAFSLWKLTFASGSPPFSLTFASDPVPFAFAPHLASLRSFPFFSSSLPLCGEQFDADLGLYFLRARFLDVQSGRFWSMDSFEGNAGDPGSLHKYLYTANDPINKWDPSGNEYSLVGKLVVGAIFGAVFGAIATIVTNHALGQEQTAESIAVGALFGAGAVALSIFSPLAGVILGGVGIGGSGYVVYQVFTNASSSRLQKTEALALLLLSIWGTRVAYKYYKSVQRGAVAETQPTPEIPRFPLDLEAPSGVILESEQPGLRGDKIHQIPGIIKSLVNGDPIDPIGGYKVGNRYIIGEGNHRMTAALKLYQETGNPQYVMQLLQQGRWTPGAPPNRTYKMTK